MTKDAERECPERIIYMMSRILWKPNSQNGSLWIGKHIAHFIFSGYVRKIEYSFW